MKQYPQTRVLRHVFDGDFWPESISMPHPETTWWKCFPSRPSSWWSSSCLGYQSCLINYQAGEPLHMCQPVMNCLSLKVLSGRIKISHWIGHLLLWKRHCKNLWSSSMLSSSSSLDISTTIVSIQSEHTNRMRIRPEEKHKHSPEAILAVSLSLLLRILIQSLPNVGTRSMKLCLKWNILLDGMQFFFVSNSELTESFCHLNSSMLIRNMTVPLHLRAVKASNLE